MENKNAEKLFQDIQKKMIVFRTTDDDKSKIIEDIRGMINQLRNSEGYDDFSSSGYENWIYDIEKELHDYEGIQRTNTKTKDAVDALER